MAKITYNLAQPQVNFSGFINDLYSLYLGLFQSFKIKKASQTPFPESCEAYTNTKNYYFNQTSVRTLLRC